MRFPSKACLSPIRNAYYSDRLVPAAARRTSGSVAGLGAAQHQRPFIDGGMDQQVPARLDHQLDAAAGAAPVLRRRRRGGAGRANGVAARVPRGGAPARGDGQRDHPGHYDRAPPPACGPRPRAPTSPPGPAPGRRRAPRHRRDAPQRWPLRARAARGGQHGGGLSVLPPQVPGNRRIRRPCGAWHACIVVKHGPGYLGRLGEALVDVKGEFQRGEGADGLDEIVGVAPQAAQRVVDHCRVRWAGVRQVEGGAPATAHPVGWGISDELVHRANASG